MFITDTAPATASPTGPWRVRDPYGGVAGVARTDGPADVARKVHDLRAAQTHWARLPARERVRWLDRFRDWMLDHRALLGESVQRESGKVTHEAWSEIIVVADLINHLGRVAPAALRDDTPAPHGLLGLSKRLRVQQVPVGVVGVISPWNFPLALALVDVVPALLAGCAVLVKPSEVTPLSVMRAVEGWREIGAPPVLVCVLGGAGVGAAVVDTVDFVQFTGSTTTGRAVAVRAAERLVPCSTELGGKDPMIVLDDAHLARAARGAAWGGLSNNGQACVAVERVYVEAAVHDEFVDRLVAEVRRLRQGPDGDVSTMTTPEQLARVQRHVEDAVARGARVLVGGRPTGRGLEFAPTVLVDVDHSMTIMREETFGPVLPVARVADEDEAVALANDSAFGLSASVWTADRSRARAVAERLEVGAVNHNDVMANLLSFAVPQAGWKESGLGTRFGGAAAVRKFCRTRALTEPRVVLGREPNWFPYTRLRSTALRILLRVAVGRGLRRWR